MARKKTPPWNGLSPYSVGKSLISHVFSAIATARAAVVKEKYHILDP
jgi:hypothetical protein